MPVITDGACTRKDTYRPRRKREKSPGSVALLAALNPPTIAPSWDTLLRTRRTEPHPCRLSRSAVCSSTCRPHQTARRDMRTCIGCVRQGVYQTGVFGVSCQLQRCTGATCSHSAPGLNFLGETPQESLSVASLLTEGSRLSPLCPL